MISSTHLISSPSADYVHSFQCLWIQKIFEKKMEDIVLEHPSHSWVGLYQAGKFAQYI